MCCPNTCWTLSGLVPSLGSLSQCSETLCVKSLFLISSLNLPQLSSMLLPQVPSLLKRVRKSLGIFFVCSWFCGFQLMSSFLVLLIGGWERARGCYLCVFKATSFPMDLMILSPIDDDVSDQVWWTFLAVKWTQRFKTIVCHMWPRPLPIAASRFGCSSAAIIAQNYIFCLPIEGFCPCGWNEWDSSVPSTSGRWFVDSFLRITTKNMC